MSHSVIAAIQGVKWGGVFNDCAPHQYCYASVSVKWVILYRSLSELSVRVLQISKTVTLTDDPLATQSFRSEVWGNVLCFIDTMCHCAVKRIPFRWIPTACGKLVNMLLAKL